jgi:hypothetical protein
MGPDSPEHGHAAMREPGEDAVREQLSRLLASPFFSHSKRFPAFLHFVVEQTVAGEAENIKERTLGVEIFGRDPDYDTASDPIVRVTAAEIRKRVAQYYQDPAHENELRIALPSGSYIPHFHWAKGGGDAGPIDLDGAAADHPHQNQSGGSLDARGRRHSSLVLVLACVAAGVLSAATAFLWQATHRKPFDFFWQPVLTAREPVLLCIADQLQYSALSLRDAAEPTRQILLKDNLTAVVIVDVTATVKVAGVLQSGEKPYNVRGEGATNLEDLRKGPTVFIGAFDNAWTLRLTNQLRFHFANNADMSQHSIVDSTNPAQSRWIVERSVQMATNNYRDYAIVARFTDSNTGKLTIVVAGIGAGIGRGGTIAAGEFLTDNGDLAQLQQAAKAAGDKTNMEVVISTQIIDGEPGSPKMEASYFW